MRAALTALAALAAIAGVGGAPACGPGPSATFGAFRELCLQHRGRPEESLRLAALAGWMPVPRMLRLYGRPEFSQPGSKWRSTAQGYSYLAAGREQQAFAGRGLAVTYCIIGQKGGDDGMIKAVEAWVSVPPSQAESGAGGRFFAFAEADDKHIALDGQADIEIKRRFEAGQVSFVMTGTDDDTVFAVYMTPAPDVLAMARTRPAS